MLYFLGKVRRPSHDIIQHWDEIQYWLTTSSRRRHTKPFSKSRRSFLRRKERQFKVEMRQ